MGPPKSAPIRSFASHKQEGDHIGKALRHDIEKFLLQSLDTFEIQIEVYPAQTANRLLDEDDRWIGFDEYDFERWGHQPKRMRIKMRQDGKPKILYKRHWRPISAFLQRLKPEEDWDGSGSRPDLMEERWRQQARWWLANGKRFRLLDLPAEIREIIYGYVFGSLIEPFRTSRSRRFNPSDQLVLNRGANFNLLLASKLVFKEASNVLFRFTTFVVQHYGIFRRLTDSLTLRSNVQQLDLALSHDEFLRVLADGSWLPPDRRSAIQKRSPAFLLRRMKLNLLRLTFAAPSKTTKIGLFDGACQKGAINLLMVTLWLYIRGHSVELSGYVKKSQKFYYEAQLLHEKKKFDFWRSQNEAAGIAEATLTEYLEEIDDEGGVVLSREGTTMNQTSGNVSETEPDESALVCRCKIPCTLETWTDGDEEEDESED